MYTTSIARSRSGLALVLAMIVAGVLLIGALAFTSVSAQEVQTNSGAGLIDDLGELAQSSTIVNEQPVDDETADYASLDREECPPVWLGPDYVAMNEFGCIDW